MKIIGTLQLNCCSLALTLCVAGVGLPAARGAEEPYYTNPVLAGDFPDPSVIRVGKEYWATATSSEWGPQFPLLRSTDLVNWQVAGTVFTNRPAWSVSNYWAPEIAQDKGRYYVYYVARKADGPLTVAVATADHPAGPYTDHGPMVSQAAGSIDPVPVTDEKGERYLLWKEDGNSRKIPTIIWAQRLNPEGTKLIGEAKELIRNDVPWEGAVIEGPFVEKRGDYFYLFYSGNACCGAACNYALGVARSKTLLGPWEKNPANPILPGNNLWRCPGHGSIVTDEKGRWWLLYHSYAAKDFVFTGRQMLLDEVTFNAAGWPTINGGKGPVDKAKAPLGISEKNSELTITEEFAASPLSPAWNWPVVDQPKARVQDGWLQLGAAQKDDVLGGVLARTLPVGDTVASTSVNVSRLKAGTTAGLAAIGDRRNATGIAFSDGKVFVWHRAKGEHQQLRAFPAPQAQQINFRIISLGGRQYTFSYSSQDGEWKEAFNAADGQHLPPWDRAVRIGLTVGGAEDVSGMFDYLKMHPLGAP